MNTDLLLRHFEHIADTPDAIPTLRRFVLDMAVRGKLVSQNPADEPAEKLLKRIAAEKKKLEKTGKIKKSNPLPPIAKDEIPFAVPNSWTWVQLQQMGKIYNGNSINKTTKHEKYSAVKNGLPFIATKDVGYGWDELDYGNGISIPVNEKNFRVAHKNAVLICSEGGSAGRKCGLVRQDICFGNKLLANELYENIEPCFVLALYQTTFFYDLIIKNMKGIIGGISKLNFMALTVPLPPLAEQKRIVAKVNQLMTLCDKLEAALITTQKNRRRLLDSLTNSA